MERNNKLNAEQTNEVIKSYFILNRTILETATHFGFSKSVVGRIVKEYKEIHINGREDYVEYTKYYYNKNRTTIQSKREAKKVANESTDAKMMKMILSKIDNLQKSIQSHTDGIIRAQHQIDECEFLIGFNKFFNNAE